MSAYTDQHLSGLSAESRAIIDAFFRWSRLSLEKLKRDVSLEANSYAAGSLTRDPGATYTRDEVARLLQGQTPLLESLIDAQAEATAAAAAELMRAVLRDADRQRLVIQVDAAAVLNNRGGVAAMGEHGRRLLQGPGGRLAPLTVADAAGEAGRQLAEANAEVRRLQVKLQQVSDAYAAVMSGRTGDRAQLLSMQDTVADTERRAAELAERARQQQQQHAAQLQQRQHQQQLEKELSEQRAKDEQLAAAVAQLRAEVADARRELNTRLNQSTQFQQLKKLLTQRNEQLRALRQGLAQYNPQLAQQLAGSGAGGDIEVEG